MLNILYIAGAGRSGSTLLDMMLGTDDRIFSSGELCNLLSAYLNNEYCSCGELLSECIFWSSVIEGWKANSGITEREIRKFADLDRSYSHPRSIVAWYCALFSPKTSTYQWYLRNLNILLESTSRKSNKEMITDSSKSPVRLLNIAKIVDGEVKIIHLVRSPHGVIESLSKTYRADKKSGVQQKIKSRHSIRSAIFWIVLNGMTEFVINRVKRKSILIRYEDVIRDPELQLQNLVPGFKVHQPLKASHLCAGNRMRMKSEISIEASGEAESKQGRIVSNLVARSSKKYGYL